ncbi:class I SAM-dependent methyltransferase [Nocardioides alcanivorans]|uniref:class I SAM-dependent methyltransferase n=1 Tax=Nocardioides alcanivorans TaxID=2897352 RepID=UPI001F2679EB|nr:class I SAM-dependent methyltransferase [Nocardioides alcanivorans]
MTKGPLATRRAGSGDDLRRSVRLFRSFLTEQTDPVGFYSLIAEDAVTLMSRHTTLAGKSVIDFGGGPGFYSEAFARHGARSVVVDADHAEITSHRRHPLSVQALAEAAPFGEGSVDIVFSSNLLEHVPDLPAVADRMASAVRPGGLVVLSYTAWLGPWGGHETSPWHYFGGHRAARRYARKHGKAPKNVFGESMYAASVAEGLRWARQSTTLELLEARPRYLPPWSRFLLRVPVVREFLTWNLWLVLRRVGNDRDTAEPKWGN